MLLVSVALPIQIEGGFDKVADDSRSFLVNLEGFDSEQGLEINTYVEPIEPYNSGILPGDYGIAAGQCVNYVRNITGFEGSGNANTWTRYINYDKPVVGSIVVMALGPNGHIGEVIYIDYENRRMLVESRNLHGLYIVSQDWFDIDDDTILGYKLI